MYCVLGNMNGANKTDAHGWIVGHMAKGIANTDDVEIKLWRYDTNPEYPKKKFLGTECIVVFSGVITLFLEKDGDELTIDLIGVNRDYVILEPGTIKKVVVKKFPAFGVTVRWPSAPNLNEMVER